MPEEWCRRSGTVRRFLQPIWWIQPCFAARCALLVLNPMGPTADRDTRILPLLRAVLMSRAARFAGEKTCFSGRFVVHPSTQCSRNSIPPQFIYGPSPPARLLPDGRCLHMSFLSRTWGFAATLLFTVIFSSDTTRTPTLSGRLSAKNKTKLFWDVFPFSSYLGAFPCG